MANYRKSLNDVNGEGDSFFFPLVFIASSSAKDTGWEKRFPHKSVIEILTVADFDQFRRLAGDQSEGKPKHRGSIYEAFKRKTEKKLLKILIEQLPQLEGKITFVDSGTPLSNNFYLGTTRGEVYGLSHSPPRWVNPFLQPDVQGIQGLKLAGQDVSCDGVCGALAGGIIAAGKISLLVYLDLLSSFLISVNPARVSSDCEKSKKDL